VIAKQSREGWFLKENFSKCILISFCIGTTPAPINRWATPPDSGQLHTWLTAIAPPGWACCPAAFPNGESSEGADAARSR